MPDHPDIHWAPRVTKQAIRRLYEKDAAGIRDEELIDEVGIALLARCQSFIDAVHAVRGRAKFHKCGGVIIHSPQRDEILKCPACGWSVTWREYFATIQHRQLSGAEPVLELFSAYIADYRAARTASDKMLLIDRVLHGFHWYAQGHSHSRPTAVNLIEGRMGDVIAFLDTLSYGDSSTTGLREKWVWWRTAMESTLKRWGSAMPRPEEPEKTAAPMRQAGKRLSPQPARRKSRGG
jgi:hypothetical protein